MSTGQPQPVSSHRERDKEEAQYILTRVQALHEQVLTILNAIPDAPTVSQLLAEARDRSQQYAALSPDRKLGETGQRLLREATALLDRADIPQQLERVTQLKAEAKALFDK